MSMLHRCRCRICDQFMDGQGFPWESPDRECQHDREKPFSTIRDGTCFVCHEYQAVAVETKGGQS